MEQICHNSEINVPDGLLGKIMSRIDEEKKLRAIKRKIAIFSVVLAVSAVALFPAYFWLSRGLEMSGFTQFLSLAFSDSGLIMTYWQNFALSLLETLPVLNLAIMLAIALVFLQSLRFLFGNIKNFKILKFTTK